MAQRAETTLLPAGAWPLSPTMPAQAGAQVAAAPAAPQGSATAREAALGGKESISQLLTTPQEGAVVREAASAEPTITGVRRATLADVPAMEALIGRFASQNRMLFRSAAELAQFIDEYVVYVEHGRLLGVCGLHPVAGGLAEVRALAVADEAGGRGIGRRLVEACLARARELGIAKVYTLTLVPGFFEKLGFVQANKARLHIKVWYECYRCPKFASCDEIAMVRPLDLES